MSASPGSLGGVRALAHLRDILTSVKVHVLPAEVAVPFVDDKFDGNGTEMLDAALKDRLEGLSASLVDMLNKTHGRCGVTSHNSRYAPQSQRSV